MAELRVALVEAAFEHTARYNSLGYANKAEEVRPACTVAEARSADHMCGAVRFQTLATHLDAQYKVRTVSRDQEACESSEANFVIQTLVQAAVKMGHVVLEDESSLLSSAAFVETV